MPNTALNRTTITLLTNKSGGDVAQGDVVVLGTATAKAFTTTTSLGYNSGAIGVVFDSSIANNATGLVATVGWVPKINLSGAATLYDFIKCYSVAKQGTSHAAPAQAGDFAQALQASATPEAILLGSPVPSAAVGGNTAIVNQLINGGFDFFQRLATATTLTTIADVKYGPDRWKMTRAAASLQTAQVAGGPHSANYAEFKQITNSGKFAVFQFLENVNSVPLLSRTMIFQCQMKASAAKTIKIALVELNTSGTIDTLPAALVGTWNADTSDPTLGTNLAYIGTPASCSVTTSFQQFSFSATLPSNSKNIGVMIYTDSAFAANDILYVAEAALFDGAIVQAWLPRPVEQELRLCQRYYEVHGDGGGGFFPRVGRLYASSASVYSVAYPFNTAKRIVPTMAVTGTWLVSNCGQPTCGGAGISGYQLGVSVTGAGEVYAVTNTADDTVTADAEL